MKLNCSPIVSFEADKFLAKILKLRLTKILFSNLEFNPRQARELILHRRGLASSADQVPIPNGVIGVTSMYVFGVGLVVSANLQDYSQVEGPWLTLMRQEGWSVHALRMLRSHGLMCPSYSWWPDRPPWYPCYMSPLLGGASQQPNIGIGRNG